MRVKNLRKEKVKRSRIILSAILTIIIAAVSLAFGGYLGYVTLNINYVTIGTMTPMVGGLLVVAGFFIFFGCAGGTIAIKELFIARRNEEKFSAYKGALVSAMVYYVVDGVICVSGFIISLASYVPSEFTWSILALCLLTLALCGSAFYCVLKEIKEHKKNKNGLKENNKNNGAFNMNLNADEIKKFRDLMMETKESQINKIKNEIEKENESDKTEKNINLEKKKALDILYSNKEPQQTQKQGEDIDFVILSRNLKQLEELRKSGLINDQEYQALKKSMIK